MRGEELEIRNAAILDALRRGVNLYEVAVAADLSVPTVRIIALGGGVKLTPEQSAKPPVDGRPDAAANGRRRPGRREHGSDVGAAPRRPEAFADRLRRYDERNAAVAEALRDPARPVSEICAAFGVNEATVLTVGWSQNVWTGPRRPRGPDRVARNEQIAGDIRAGATCDEVTKKWGISAANVAAVARDAGLQPPEAPVRRGRQSTRARRQSRDRKMVADLVAGLSVDEVAEKYGLAPSTVVSYARANGVQVARPPRPLPETPSTRDQELVRRAVEGESFADLARAFELSRERVRQIVWRYQEVGAKELADQRSARQLLAKEQRLELLAADRPDLSFVDLAAEVGLPADRVVALLGAVEAARRAPLGEERGFDVPSALREMRRIYRLGGFKPLTGTAYDKHRRTYVVGSSTLVVKFGSWAAACAAANIIAPEPKRRVYEREWTSQRCLAWVASFLMSSTSVRSSDFAVWSQAHRGPSVATVRNRCGMWGQTLRDAAALVSQPGWEPPEIPATDHGQAPPGA